MEQSDAFGADTLWSTNAINDTASPSCWLTFALTADTTRYLADTTQLTADRTQL
tara:strand:- start:190 stop:351 length:162 start_codon:yes stop_codon:yes gene_type:complete